MPYDVVYKKSVYRDLRKLPRAEADRLLHQIGRQLSSKPESNPALRGQFAGLRRLRVGDYRVICALIANEVLVLRIGHGRDVYKHEI